MSKQFWGVIVLIIAIFIGIFVLTGKSEAPSANTSGKTLTNHVTGEGKANVTLVEYGDYQCPHCGDYYPIVKQATAEYKDQIHFQFRNFPISSAHPNAFAAARAAEAAALQNKFWEMHDMLFETQRQWAQMSDAIPAFEQFAQQIGLDVPKFKTDFASSKVNDLINADQAEGTKLGVTGTPAFFLDGKQIELALNVASFEKAIKAEIAKKAPTATTPPQANGNSTTPTP